MMYTVHVVGTVGSEDNNVIMSYRIGKKKKKKKKNKMNQQPKIKSTEKEKENGKRKKKKKTPTRKNTVTYYCTVLTVKKQVTLIITL